MDKGHLTVLGKLHEQFDRIKHLRSWAKGIICWGLFSMFGIYLTEIIFGKWALFNWSIDFSNKVLAVNELVCVFVGFLLAHKSEVEAKRYKEAWSKSFQSYNDKLRALYPTFPESLREMVEEYAECKVRAFQLDVVLDPRDFLKRD